MRLSIVNYGASVSDEVPRYAKQEDNKIISNARELVEKHNMGTGALLVSEVLHTDLMNSNKRAYQSKGMPESAQTFCTPYFTPFLMHHEMGGGSLFSDGNPNLVSIGTNVTAKYIKRNVETIIGPATGYVKVGTFVHENMTVGNMNAIDLIQSRNLLTLSLGARVHESNYICSICGHSLRSEDCEHELGQEYDESVCFAKVYHPLFKEYSAVYDPSDVMASIRRMDVMEGEGSDSFDDMVIDEIAGMGSINLYEMASKTYPSVEVPENNGDDPMKSKNKQSTTDTTSADEKSVEALEARIADLEEDIQSKDEIILTLSRALREKIEATSDQPVEDADELPLSTEDEDDNTATGENEEQDSDNPDDEGEKPEGNDEEDGEEDGKEDEDEEDEGKEKPSDNDSDSEDTADGENAEDNAEEDGNVTDNTNAEDGGAEDTTGDDSSREETSAQDEGGNAHVPLRENITGRKSLHAFSRRRGFSGEERQKGIPFRVRINDGLKH